MIYNLDSLQSLIHQYPGNRLLKEINIAVINGAPMTAELVDRIDSIVGNQQLEDAGVPYEPTGTYPLYGRPPIVRGGVSYSDYAAALAAVTAPVYQRAVPVPVATPVAAPVYTPDEVIATLNPAAPPAVSPIINIQSPVSPGVPVGSGFLSRIKPVHIAVAGLLYAMSRR